MMKKTGGQKSRWDCLFKKTIHDFFSSNLVKQDLDLDPDPHSEKLPDPDPHKVNADPQPCKF